MDNELTKVIINSSYKVYNYLGSGFLEKVYCEALEIEFHNNSILFKRENEIPIYYKNIKLNCLYKADFVCYNQILIEVKAVKYIDAIHYAQILNYLKATKLKIGLIINFGGKELEIKRFIL
jgi:GxxExxY protein